MSVQLLSRPHRVLEAALPLLVFVLLAVPAADVEGQLTGTSARTGTVLAVSGPSAAADIRQVFGNHRVTAGPIQVDGRTGTVTMDVTGVKLELGDNRPTALRLDLRVLEVGVLDHGGLLTTWLEVEVPSIGSLRLEMDGVAGPGMVTTSSAYHGAPPATPWRILGTRRGQAHKQVLWEGNRDQDGVRTGVGAFRVTSSALAPSADLNMACRSQFGGDARLADWNDVIEARRQTMDPSSILPARSPTVHVSAGGARFWTQGRHFLLARHDGAPPSSFLAHDQVGGHQFSLGSWSGTRAGLCFVPLRP